MFSDVLIFPFHSRSADGALVRSYNRSFNAFAARLSHAEAERISGKFFKILLHQLLGGIDIFLMCDDNNMQA
jgi:hypothetical protein